MACGLQDRGAAGVFGVRYAGRWESGHTRKVILLLTGEDRQARPLLGASRPSSPRRESESGVVGRGFRRAGRVRRDDEVPPPHVTLQPDIAKIARRVRPRKMLVLLMLAAAQAADPTAAAIPVGNPYSPSDYPLRVLQQNVSGRVRVEVTISPEGKPFRCQPVAPSGSPELDAVTCSSMMKRGRFKPALDHNGQPRVGVVRQTAIWFVGDASVERRIPKINDIDVRATVQKLPAGFVSPVEVTTDLVVDETGSIEHCAARPVEKDRTEFSAVACRQAMLLGHLAPAKDVNGAPVASVQQAKISFSLPVAAPETVK